MVYFQELPLALFTLMAQLAVGIVLVGQCVIACGAGDDARRRVRLQTLPALGLFAIGTLISLGHTGSPLHGPFTILHLDSSWLSREIAMVGVTGLAFLWLAFLRFKKPYGPREGLAAWLTVAAGVVLIYVMSSVYNQRFMPGWHSPAVFPLFLSSMVMLGALWQGAALSFGPGMPKEPSDHRTRHLGPILLWALAGYVLMAACLPLSLPDVGVPTLNTATVLLPYESLSRAHAVHALLSGLGVFLAATAVLGSVLGSGAGANDGPEPEVAHGARLRAILTVPAFLLLLAGELFGRLTFYASYSRLGM